MELATLVCPMSKYVDSLLLICSELGKEHDGWSSLWSPDALLALEMKYFGTARVFSLLQMESTRTHTGTSAVTLELCHMAGILHESESMMSPACVPYLILLFTVFVWQHFSRLKRWSRMEWRSEQKESQMKDTLGSVGEQNEQEKQEKRDEYLPVKRKSVKEDLRQNGAGDRAVVREGHSKRKEEQESECKGDIASTERVCCDCAYLQDHCHRFVFVCCGFYC